MKPNGSVRRQPTAWLAAVAILYLAVANLLRGAQLAPTAPTTDVVATGTLSSLRSIPYPVDGQTVIIQGHSRRGDGGGGTFYWDAVSTAPTNRGTILAAPPQSTGRWIRICSGSLNVRWFGAKGDGSQDDAPFIQNAIDSLPPNGGSVYIPAGDYLLNAPLARRTLANLPNPEFSTDYNFCLLVAHRQNVRITGDGTASRLFVPQARDRAYLPSDPSVLAFESCTNCEVQSLEIAGAAKKNPGSNLRDGAAIFLHQCTGMRVTDCSVQDASIGILGWATRWSRICENQVSGVIALSGIEFYNNGTGDADHNIIANNLLDGGAGSTICMGIVSDCGYTTIANNTLRGVNLESIVLEGGSNRLDSIVGNTIETRSYYGVELRSSHHSVVCGNVLDGGGMDLNAKGNGDNPPAHVVQNVLVANVVLGGRSDQTVYIGTARPKDITAHNLVCDNLIQPKTPTFGIQLGNARFNQISGNHISHVTIGVTMDASDTMVDGNSIYTTIHGIYASNFGLREFVHGNYLAGSDARGSSGVFLNQSYTDAYVVDNEERNFGQGDVLAAGHSSTFAYSSRYSLALQPEPAPPSAQPWNSPGMIYMNNSLPGKGFMGCDMNGTWHPMW